MNQFPVFGICALIGAALAIWLPETQGRCILILILRRIWNDEWCFWPLVMRWAGRPGLLQIFEFSRRTLQRDVSKAFSKLHSLQGTALHCSAVRFILNFHVTLQSCSKAFSLQGTALHRGWGGDSPDGKCHPKPVEEEGSWRCQDLRNAF